VAAPLVAAGTLTEHVSTPQVHDHAHAAPAACCRCCGAPCRYLDQIGYAVSAYGFSGPFIPPEAIEDGRVRLDAVNLYCVRKDLRQALLAQKAGVTAPKRVQP
jgi:hypothetical protein